MRTKILPASWMIRMKRKKEVGIIKFQLVDSFYMFISLFHFAGHTLAYEITTDLERQSALSLTNLIRHSLLLNLLYYVVVYGIPLRSPLD